MFWYTACIAIIIVDIIYNIWLLSQIWLTVEGWHGINRQYLIYNYSEYSEKKDCVLIIIIIIDI